MLLGDNMLGQLSDRPRTRGDCIDGERPCPWQGCRYHLALDVSPSSGSIKINHPDLDLDQHVETCALDVAEHGAQSLDIIGRLLNISRQAVQQIEGRAMRKFRRRATP